ncbi:MAG: BamA/TamA family outer membrane protein, partial [Bacteroidales bacterium]|nr:BamA/TamA family outer membrane protein [Bacteroidales bacterium]
MKLFLLFIIFFFLFKVSFAQAEQEKEEMSSADKTQLFIEKAFKYAPLPFPGYATETGLVLGITKYNAFKFKSDILPDSLIQPSSVLAYAYFTQEHQYKLYLITDFMHSNNKINSKFEFMFLDYPSYYFGVGNTNDFDSSYLVDFKNVMVAPSVSYNVVENLYVGAKYTYNNYITIESLDSKIGDTTLADNQGLQSGLGLVVFREARDNRIRATKGSYLNASFDLYNESFGSKFNYSQFTLDYRYYFT